MKLTVITEILAITASHCVLGQLQGGPGYASQPDLKVPISSPASLAGARQDYKRTDQEGTLTGGISLTGEPPAPPFIRMDSEPACVPLSHGVTAETVVLHGDRLANVLVYVKGGGTLDKYSFTAPTTEVVLAHRGCRFVPHVLGVQTQQTLKVINLDPTNHNTNTLPEHNRGWNETQTPGGQPLERKFARPEVPFLIKCNQHPWEWAYLGVFPHPFFAVSSEGGTYTIEGLPPGDYTVVAWHECYGEQEASVTVSPKQVNSLDFTFAHPPKPIRVSSGLLHGKASKKVLPSYPDEAKAAGIPDRVEVEVVVSEEGAVTEARVIDGHELLREAALEAAKSWTFSPTFCAGPVKVQGILIIVFQSQ